MSLRDEFEKRYVGRFPNALLDRDGDSYYFAGPRESWQSFQAGYQSATERALRIVREQKQAVNTAISDVLFGEVERRLKGDDNG